MLCVSSLLATDVCAIIFPLTDIGCSVWEIRTRGILRLGEDDKACRTSYNLTVKQRDSDWREAMRARREARMVSACSPCTNIRLGLISVTYLYVKTRHLYAWKIRGMKLNYLIIYHNNHLLYFIVKISFELLVQLYLWTCKIIQCNPSYKIEKMNCTELSLCS